MKRRHVVFLPEAQADLLWIYDAVAHASGNLTAIRYIERIERFAWILTTPRNVEPEGMTCGRGFASLVSSGD